MAVEVENTSQVDEFLRVLKRRLWWILVPTVIISTLGIIYAVVVPKKYVARAQVMVYDRGAGTTKEGRVAVHKIKAPQRIIAVLKKLEWPEYEELPTNADALDYRKAIGEKIKVDTPVMERAVGQQLVVVSYAHTNANQAVDFLRELLADWKFEVLESSNRALKDEYQKLADQLSDLNKQRKDLDRGIVQLRRDNNIPPQTNNGPGQSRFAIPAYEDVAKFDRRISEYEEVIAKKSHAVDIAKARHSRMRDTTLVPTSSGPKVQTALDAARRDLDNAKRVLEEGGWGPEHSKYKQALAKVNTLQSKVNQLRGVAPVATNVRDTKINEAKIELGDQIAIMEAEIERTRASLADAKGQLREATSRALDLQKVYNEIESKTTDRNNVDLQIRESLLMQNKVRSQIARQEGPMGNPFDELERVTASEKPVEPDARLLSAVAILLGLGVGVALALGLEYSRNCFRSINDIAQSMEIPVLGAINKIETRKQRSVRQAQRLAMGLSMLLMVGVVAYALWAWVEQPHLLSPKLVESIDRLREYLG